MKENPYDNQTFFEQYSRMPRSVEGLSCAGEWHELQKMLPCFAGQRVLDLGCGFGWHCRYAAEQGAVRVVGVDLSQKMLQRAREMTASPVVSYAACAIEDYLCEPGSFDVAVSSLALHYVEQFETVCNMVCRALAAGGDFIFSVEHPVFTAAGSQQWYCDREGKPLHWPVDRYFQEGRRDAVFLGEDVVKYHKTLTTYLRGLLQNGFSITDVVEPQPPAEMFQRVPGMEEELRRPMMLLVSARKDG